MSKDFNETMLFKMPREGKEEIVEIISKVYESLNEKGYDPENQIIGYILSGDPTYITSHNGARKLIRQVDRNELLEELLAFYLKNNNINEK